MADYTDDTYKAVQDAFRYRGIDAASGGETADERYKRIAGEVGSGSRTIESVGTSLDPYAAFDPDTYTGVRSAFEDRGLGIATAGETEEERLRRIAMAIAAGDRTLEGLGTDLDAFATVPDPLTPEQKLAALRDERLAAALGLIGTTYDAQRGDYRSQQNALTGTFEDMMAQLGVQEEAGTRQIEDSMAERGLHRSGIFAQETARFLDQIGQQAASTERVYSTKEGDEGTEWQRLQSALLALDAQQAGEEAAAKLQKEQDELEMEQLEALAAAGLA